jgi:hypothetical protein
VLAFMPLRLQIQPPCKCSARFNLLNSCVDLTSNRSVITVSRAFVCSVAPARTRISADRLCASHAPSVQPASRQPQLAPR